MTISELILELQKFPQDAAVLVRDSEYGYPINITHIGNLHKSEKDYVSTDPGKGVIIIA